MIDGRKRWIGNGTIADVIVVWARRSDGQVKEFLVEKGAPGLETHMIEHKGSMRRGAAGRHRIAGSGRR